MLSCRNLGVYNYGLGGIKMFGFFVIIAAMALTIFYFTIDKIGKRSDVDKVIDFLEDLVEMDAFRIEIGSNCGQKALAKSDPVKTKNKKKKDKKRKKNDSEILQLINKIDKKLEKGYTFANISRNHYEKIYKEEILNLYKTSKLKGEAEDSIKEVLESLLGDLRKPGESFTNKLETKASIDTLDAMLTMDGIKESELQIVARESLTKSTSKRISDMLGEE